MQTTESADKFEHLNALELRRHHERTRLVSARTVQERELRTVWVKQIEREIVAERQFLGLGPEPAAPVADDDLFAEIGP